MKKHINLSSWTLSITDWTNLNYVLGGLDESYADVANVKGNYIKKSENLLIIPDVAETTTNGVTYKVEKGVITLSGTASANTNINLILSDTQYPISSIGLFNNVTNSNVNFYNRTQNGSWGSIGFNLNTTNKTYTYNNNTNLYGFRLFIMENAVISNMVIKPMLVSGSTAPTDYQPGSTTGLYIEDNVNDKLIPVNE